jgi:hypothetical protein
MSIGDLSNMRRLADSSQVCELMHTAEIRAVAHILCVRRHQVTEWHLPRSIAQTVGCLVACALVMPHALLHVLGCSGLHTQEAAIRWDAAVCMYSTVSGQMCSISTVARHIAQSLHLYSLVYNIVCSARAIYRCNGIVFNHCAYRRDQY